MNIPDFASQWQLYIFILFCTFCAIQLFYFLFFFLRLVFFKSESQQQQQTHPVSVVICARDEAENLANNLPGLLAQEYPTTHEIIVVNDNSFDESKYLLEELKKSFKQLNIIELTQEAKMIPGKKFPLAIGIKSAKYEIVLLSDADCLPATENWINSMQSAFTKNTEIVLGYSPFQKQNGLLNKLIRFECFFTAMQYLSYALAGIPYMGVGRNLSYKKSLFLKQKGFSAHNNIPGGDDDLFINAVANKKNTTININTESFTISKPAQTWAKWIRQKNRHYTTSKYYKRIHKFLLGLFAISHFLFYPLMILSMLFYSWKLSLIVYFTRAIFQMLIYSKNMIQLKEKDLIPFIPLLDLWMFIYYLIFAPALLKKPLQTWK
jgi:cellulose synthase/poly-beta-1,6-N-acetylglucosamine synthase-like glycosyltransferase